MINAATELERFLDRRASLFTDAIRALVSAKAGDGDYSAAFSELSLVLMRTLILADLNGRKRVFMELDRAQRRAKARFAGADTPIASIPFDEAVNEILSSEPRLAATSAEVARLYSQEHIFALAKSVDETVTQRIQMAVTDAVCAGRGLDETAYIIDSMGDWTRAYSENVYRTNVARAYNDARFAQARKPGVADIVPAMEYFSVRDSRTRANHAAAHGFIAATDDPMWRFHAPPQGWQCRCSAELVSRYELERRGLITKDGKVIRYIPSTFAEATPDKGFHSGWGGIS